MIRTIDITYNNDLGKFIKTETVDYEDGNLTTIQIPLTEQEIRQDYLAKILDRIDTFNTSINQIWSKTDLTNIILQDIDNDLVGFLSNRILEDSISRFGNAAAGQWQLTLNGGNPVNVNVTVKNSSRLELTVGQNSFDLFLIGDKWIRLLNYPTNSFTDLHRVSGNGVSFRSVGEDINLQRN